MNQAAKPERSSQRSASLVPAAVSRCTAPGGSSPLASPSSWLHMPTAPCRWKQSRRTDTTCSRAAICEVGGAVQGARWAGGWAGGAANFGSRAAGTASEPCRAGAPGCHASQHTCTGMGAPGVSSAAAVPPLAPALPGSEKMASSTWGGVGGGVGGRSVTLGHAVGSALLQAWAAPHACLGARRLTLSCIAGLSGRQRSRSVSCSSSTWRSEGRGGASPGSCRTGLIDEQAPVGRSAPALLHHRVDDPATLPPTALLQQLCEQHTCPSTPPAAAAALSAALPPRWAAPRGWVP